MKSLEMLGSFPVRLREMTHSSFPLVPVVYIAQSQMLTPARLSSPYLKPAFNTHSKPNRMHIPPCSRPKTKQKPVCFTITTHKIKQHKSDSFYDVHYGCSPLIPPSKGARQTERKC